MFIRFLLLLTLCLFGSCTYAGAAFNTCPCNNEEEEIKMLTAHNYNPGIIKHIVLFRYKDNVSQEQKKEVIQRFLKLRDSKRPGETHPYIINITTGLQNSAEKLSMGFEQAFIVTFSSEGDRNYYVGPSIFEESSYYDPNHAEFKKFVSLLLASDGVLVFDFNTDSHR